MAPKMSIAAGKHTAAADSTPTIQHHGQVRLLVNNPSRGHGTHDSGTGRNEGRNKNVGNRAWIGRQHRSPIEPEPPEPEQEHANGCQRHAVAADRPDAAAHVLAQPWPEQNHPRQSPPPAN